MVIQASTVLAACVKGQRIKDKFTVSILSVARERHGSDIIGCRSQMVQDLVSPVKEFIDSYYEHLILSNYKIESREENGIQTCVNK